MYELNWCGIYIPIWLVCLVLGGLKECFYRSTGEHRLRRNPGPRPSPEFRLTTNLATRSRDCRRARFVVPGYGLFDEKTAAGKVV
jgi:hypothetical protein